MHERAVPDVIGDNATLVSHVLFIHAVANVKLSLITEGHKGFMRYYQELEKYASKVNLRTILVYGMTKPTRHKILDLDLSNEHHATRIEIILSYLKLLHRIIFINSISLLTIIIPPYT